MAGATGFFPPLVSEKKVYQGAYLSPQKCSRINRDRPEMFKNQQIGNRQEINKVCYFS